MSQQSMQRQRVSPGGAADSGGPGSVLRAGRPVAPEDMRPEALSAASGITDPALLEKLVAAGIDGDTLTALSLVPLVAVAWADGSMDTAERAAVLRAATQAGIEPGGDAFRLLEDWLAGAPAPELMEAWRAYVRDRAEAMDPGAAKALRLHLLGRARRVAEAAGCILGHEPQVSAAELAVLAGLEEAFGLPVPARR